MQKSRYGNTNLSNEYLIYPFNSPISYDVNYTGTYSKYSLIDKYYVDTLVKPQKRLISGGAEWGNTGNGMTFSLPNIVYTFTGEILTYTASTPVLSFDNGDPLDRIDSIVIDEDNTISVVKGEPALEPANPPLLDNQLLIQYAYIVASSSSIGTSEAVYLNNSQWNTSTYQLSGSLSGSVDLASGLDQYASSNCVDVNTDYRTGVKFTKSTSGINTVDYGSVTMRVKFIDVIPDNKSLFVQIQGTSSGYLHTGNTLNLMTYGLERDVINEWQHIVVPVSKFGTNVPTIDTLTIRMAGGDSNVNTNWRVDYIFFQKGVVFDGYMGEPGSSGSGASGTSGTSGSSGTSGLSGTSGTRGTSGSSGIDGTSGSSGIDGTSGSSGANGTSGSSGTNGTSGSSGNGFTTIVNAANNSILTSDGTTHSAVAESNLTFDGSTLVLNGDFMVTGTTSIVNTQNLSIQDPIILLSSTQSGTPILDSGFMISRGTGATQAFIWDESENVFSFVETDDDATVIGNVNITAYSDIRARLATFDQIKLNTGASNGYILTSDATGLATWTASVLNGVTASGTSNYVPYWNTSTNLSSTSSIYISNNNVGIGTQTPTASLHINNIGASASFLVEDSSNPDSSPFIIDNDGRVGIGVTNPLFNLDILSNGASASFENISRFRTIDSTDHLTITNAISTDGSFNPVIRSFNNTNVSTNLYLQSVIDTSVDTGVNPLIMLQGRVNTDPIIGGGTWSSVITRPILRVRNNSTDLLQVNADGNVGIGTTTPSAKLNVVSSNTISFPATTGTTQSGEILRLRNVTSNSVLDFGNFGANANWMQSTSRIDLSVNLPLLINPNGGNVGIGLTAPSNVLDIVQGSSQLAVDLDNASGPLLTLTTSDTDNLIRFGASDGSSSISLGTVGSTWTGSTGYGKPSDNYIYSNSSANGLNIISQPGSGTEDYIRFYAGGNPMTTTANLYISGSGSSLGYVGVGTENPGNRLHIYDSVANSVLTLESGDARVNLRLQDSLSSNVPLVGADSDILTLGHISGGDKMIITPTGDVGIGELFAPTIANGKPNPDARLHVIGGTSSPVVKVDGTSGELFKIDDSLTGSIYSINDISGLPILEVFDDNTIIIGDYQAPSLYTTKKVVTTVTGTSSVYSIPVTSYTSAHIEYNIKNGSNLRSGNLVAVWDGTNIQFTEISTLDIGDTTNFSFNMVISSGNFILQGVSAISGWTIKTIIRSI